jgi:hypothetical protein
VFLLTLGALMGPIVIAWALARRSRSGRHQRSPLGPVRGDGSGWTEEALASDFPDQPRGPEDDPEFVARLARQLRPHPGPDA